MNNELDQLIKSGQLERLETIEEDCLLSPVKITVRKDKAVKTTLEARKLNESCLKKRPHMQNMDELVNQISDELSTRRERLKSAACLRLKKRKKNWKKLVNFQKKSHSAENCKRRDPLGCIDIHSVANYEKT